jgi:uncharacterized membrane protein YhaH (DUF805 family)
MLLQKPSRICHLFRILKGFGPSLDSAVLIFFFFLLVFIPALTTTRYAHDIRHYWIWTCFTLAKHA